MSALTIVIIKNNNDVTPNVYTHKTAVALYENIEANAKTNVKKNPKFLFEGSLISENFMFYKPIYYIFTVIYQSEFININNYPTLELIIRK